MIICLELFCSRMMSSLMSSRKPHDVVSPALGALESCIRRKPDQRNREINLARQHII